MYRWFALAFDVTGDSVVDDIECKIWALASYVQCPVLSKFEQHIATLYYTTH